MFGTVESQDRETYAGYVVAQIAAFQEWAGGVGAVWNHSALTAAGLRGRGPSDTSEAGVFRGPWHTVRPYVTAEFDRWVNDGYGTRMTFAEFRDSLRAERAREREYMDSPDYVLGQLEQLQQLLAIQDELVAEARRRGASSAEVEAAAGMSRMTVHRAVKRHEIAELAAAWDDPNAPF